eukprot:TRINITY_DN5628_c0_g1_i2.p1 TRINITY_DN5628_c0_g1~~TRINITY_DN5628_c0_g1_i2.p1  ORF type:complete len:519 (+),score=102.31 TRINITY_DN5628_c0_g1_i2:246-1802(+)
MTKSSPLYEVSPNDFRATSCTYEEDDDPPSTTNTISCSTRDKGSPSSYDHDGYDAAEKQQQQQRQQQSQKHGIHGNASEAHPGLHEVPVQLDHCGTGHDHACQHQEVVVVSVVRIDHQEPPDEDATVAPPTGRELARFMGEILLAVVGLVVAMVPIIVVVTRMFYRDPSTNRLWLGSPWSHIGSVPMTVMAVSIPWATLVTCWGVHRRCTVWNVVFVALGLGFYALCYALRISPAVMSLGVQGLLGLLMFLCGYYFAQLNGCSLWRAAALFVLPMFVVLVVVAVYDSVVLTLFIRGGTLVQLVIRLVVHPLLFSSAIQVMQVQNIKWDVSRPDSHCSIILFVVGIKLFWGRFFSANMESLSGVFLSSAAISVAEIAYRLLSGHRARLRRRLCGQPKSWFLRRSIALQYLMFERIFELSFIVLSFVMLCFHRAFLHSGIDLRLALSGMAIQLALEVACDVVVFWWEIRRLRWPVLQEWSRSWRGNYLYSLYAMAFMCSVFWERALLLLLNKTMADAPYS